MAAITNIEWLSVPTHRDTRGAVSYGQLSDPFPFEIKRVYYLYDVPGDGARGAHAHKQLHQVFIAISGRFRLRFDDGANRLEVVMDKPDHALYVPPMIWRDLDCFSADAVCLVLASARFDDADYIRDYEDFVSLAKGTSTP